MMKDGESMQIKMKNIGMSVIVEIVSPDEVVMNLHEGVDQEVEVEVTEEIEMIDGRTRPIEAGVARGVETETEIEIEAETETGTGTGTRTGTGTETGTGTGTGTETDQAIIGEKVGGVDIQVLVEVLQIEKNMGGTDKIGVFPGRKLEKVTKRLQGAWEVQMQAVYCL